MAFAADELKQYADLACPFVWNFCHKHHMETFFDHYVLL